MDINIIRRGNGRAIAKQLGSQKKLAAAMGKKESQISHTLGKNPKRNIGDPQAREMEIAGNKPEFWLDQYHSDIEYEVAEKLTPSTGSYVAEPDEKYQYAAKLSEAEHGLIEMWRSWTPSVKQYAFGQMRIVHFTKDVLAQMFLVDNKETVTDADVENEIIDTVSETGTFRRLANHD